MGSNPTGTINFADFGGLKRVYDAPGSKPLHIVLVSLVGQDSRLSPDRPGFKSRTRNFASFGTVIHLGLLFVT